MSNEFEPVVICVDCNPLTRASVQQAIHQRYPEGTVHSYKADGVKTHFRLASNTPDILVFNLNGMGTNEVSKALELADAIHDNHPRVKIIAIGGNDIDPRPFQQRMIAVIGKDSPRSLTDALIKAADSANPEFRRPAQTLKYRVPDRQLVT